MRYLVLPLVPEHLEKLLEILDPALGPHDVREISGAAAAVRIPPLPLVGILIRHVRKTWKLCLSV